MCKRTGEIEYNCGHKELRTPSPCGAAPLWHFGESAARGTSSCGGRFSQVITTYYQHLPCSKCGPGSESRRRWALEKLQKK